LSESPLLVTAAVIEDGERILIAKRPAQGAFPSLWEFPGGKIEAGESPEEALARELREELRIEVRVGKIYDVVFHRYDLFSVLLLFYRCEIVEGSPKACGCELVRWVPRTALSSYEFLPADRAIIHRLAFETE
jgi:mutator protein MutT